MVSIARSHGGGELERAGQIRALARLTEALDLLDKSSGPPDIRARLHENIDALKAFLGDPG